MFPSLSNTDAQNTIDALRASDLNVYAPRAGRFLEGDEATELFGVFANIFGVADLSEFSGYEFNQYKGWLNFAIETGKKLLIVTLILRRFLKTNNLSSIPLLKIMNLY